jgi:hypothetical protein
VKESAERIVKVGLHRSPKKVFDDVEELTARMKREGWTLRDSIMEEGLGKIHLFFEREINTIIGWSGTAAGPVHKERTMP